MSNKSTKKTSNEAQSIVARALASSTDEHGVIDLPVDGWAADWDNGRTVAPFGETKTVAFPAAVRIAETQIVEPQHDGDLISVKHRIEIARGQVGTSERRVTRSGWIGDRQLSDPQTVLLDGGHDVAFPNQHRESAAFLEQMLRREAPPARRVVPETGWKATPNGIRFLLPGASIGADGRDESIVATINKVMDPRIRIRLGDVTTALHALKAAWAPLRDDALATHVGVMASQTQCFVGSDPRGSLAIVGRAQSGKTQTVMSAVMIGRGWAPEHKAIMVSADSSKGVLNEAGAGMTGLPVIIDDLRDPNPDEGRGAMIGAATGGLDTAVRRGYQGGEAGRSRLERNSSGHGFSPTPPPPGHPMIFFTSEVDLVRLVPNSVGFESRYLTLPFAEGSAPDGGVALNQLCADGHLEVLAFEIIRQTAAAFNDVDDLRRAARERVDEKARVDYAAFGPRQGGIIAHMAMGADVLRKLAIQHDVDLSLELDRAETAWVAAAQAGAESIRTRARSAGMQIIGELKEALISGRAVLLNGAEWRGGTGAYNPADELVPLIGECREDAVMLLSAEVAAVIRAGRSPKSVSSALSDIRGVDLKRVRINDRQVRAAVVPRKVWENETEGETDV